MTIKFTRSLATALFLLIGTSPVVRGRQADKNEIAAVERPAGGFVIVWNKPDLHFTIELKGKSVEPDSSAPSGIVAFKIDGIVLQIQSAAISEFAKDARKQKLTDLAILEAHRDWESRYQEQNLGVKISVASVPQQLSGVGDALIWKFDMPKTKKPVRQMYLTTVSGKSVVILNGVVAGTIPEATVQKLLLDTMSTLKVSPRPIDVQKLRESVQPTAAQSPSGAQDDVKLKHDWKIEESQDGNGINFTSRHPAPPPFSYNQEPEAKLTVESDKAPGKAPSLSAIVASELKDIRNGLMIGDYLEDDGHKPQNGVATWNEDIDGQQVAFIKYRVVGVKGEGRASPRTVIHAIFISKGKVYFLHLIVLFAAHQDEVRADQIRLIRSIIRK